MTKGNITVVRTQAQIVEILERIKEKKCEICFYGAGIVGMGMGPKILSFVEIYPDFYCDKDESKWNKKVCGDTKCYSPDVLKDKRAVCCFVLVGQKYEYEAYQWLKSIGLPDENIILYDEICNLDTVVDDFYRGEINRSLFLGREGVYDSHSHDVEYRVGNDKKKKMAVYTCITGNYDEVVEPEMISDQCDYYLVSDTKPEGLKVFRWIDAKEVIPSYIDDNFRRNRYCKIVGYKIFDEYEYSLYIDGNISVVGDVTNYDRFVKSLGFATHNHAFNKDIYAEGIKLIAAGRVQEEETVAQIKVYKEEGMPRNFGQFHNAVLVRENSNILLEKLMQDWWKEVFTKVYRDQFSLAYCMWKNGIATSEVGIIGENMRQNKDFKWVKLH